MLGRSLSHRQPRLVAATNKIGDGSIESSYRQSPGKPGVEGLIPTFQSLKNDM